MLQSGELRAVALDPLGDRLAEALLRLGDARLELVTVYQTTRHHDGCLGPTQAPRVCASTETREGTQCGTQVLHTVQVVPSSSCKKCPSQRLWT